MKPPTATELRQPGGVYILPSKVTPDSETGRQFIALLKDLHDLQQLFMQHTKDVASMSACIQHAATCPSISCIHSYARLFVDEYKIEPPAHTLLPSRRPNANP